MRAAGGDDAAGHVRVGGHAEEPGWYAELGVAGAEGLAATRLAGCRPEGRRTDTRTDRDTNAVEVPPAAAVGDERETALGVEARLLDGFGVVRVAAGDQACLPRQAGVVQVGEVERGRVPGHVGVVPAQPCEAAAVRGQARRAEEVGAGDEFGGWWRLGGGLVGR